MRDITLCHPRLQKLATELIQKRSAQGLQIKIGEALRTGSEQDTLYAQGRTTPGSIVTNAPGSSYSSYHQWGTAFDIYRADGCGAYYDKDGFFSRVGAIGVSIGLEWGGNWKSIVDKPHFQLPDWGSSTSGIKKEFKTPEEFMKTWKEEEKVVEGWQMDVISWWHQNVLGSRGLGDVYKRQHMISFYINCFGSSTFRAVSDNKSESLKFVTIRLCNVSVINVYNRFLRSPFTDSSKIRFKSCGGSAVV